MRGISVPNGTEFPSSRGKGAIFSLARPCLISKRRRSIDHLELLFYLLDLAEKVDRSEEQLTNTSTSSSMLNTSGSYKVLKVITLHK